MTNNNTPILAPLRFKQAAESAFRQELRQEAQSYLDQRGEHRFGNGWQLVKGAFLAALAGALYWCALHADRPLQFIPAYFGFIFVAMVLAMNLLHDAAHQAVFRSAALNRLLIRIVSIPVGIDPDFWVIRHVHFHHTYANIDGYDLDIEPNPFLRQTPFQRWLPQFRYQHMYWPLIAALSLPYLCWYSDWIDRLGQTKIVAQGSRSGWPSWPLFLSAKLVHLCVVLVLPIWLLPNIGWGQVLACYFLGLMLASCFLVAMILGTHWAEVDFFQAPADGKMPHTWLEHTFHTSCDWAPRPRWLGYWLGGLNYHLTHHLFPTYSHRHYRQLAGIIARLAVKHRLAYRELNYVQLITSQQKFLKAMGGKPSKVE
ncbi:acyl-CoA desaturase [Paraherbaspirillum soli]|uniref:Acyl-CoA desaturase n=1 Tax=Paraherbaspirillum soli TaxID=631222 RepID=A0ABW0MA67_9BURK